MTNYLPAMSTNAQAIENLRQAAAGVGSGTGTGEVYLKVDDRTGVITYGQEKIVLQPGHKFVVGLHSFCHGYIVMSGGKPSERKLVPMMAQAQRPTPPNGAYAKRFGEDGAKDTTEITLNSVDEPGFNLTFTAWSISSANRVRNLLEAAIVHTDTPDGQAGFEHPVIAIKSGKWRSSRREDPITMEIIPERDIHHFDYTVVDWLHRDGKTFLSKHGGGAIEDQSDEDPVDGMEDDLSEAERELMNLR